MLGLGQEHFICLEQSTVVGSCGRLSFEAEACRAHSPRQEKEDPQIDVLATGYKPVN